MDGAGSTLQVQTAVKEPMEETAKSNERKPAAARPTHKTQSFDCPRCDSPNTKFCYYNNYSLSQPRFFCRACRRYWTHGGSLRNIPVGGGSRKNKTTSSRMPPNSENPSFGQEYPVPSFVATDDSTRVPISSSSSGSAHHAHRTVVSDLGFLSGVNTSAPPSVGLNSFITGSSFPCLNNFCPDGLGRGNFQIVSGKLLFPFHEWRHVAEEEQENPERKW